MTEALRELWERGGFKSRRVWMGVGNQRVVVREIALPFLPEKELKASLGFQVQEFIPMPVDEAVLDYDPIGEFEQDDRQMLRMLLVAAQRVMVDQLVNAAIGAKLEPVGLDLVPFALVRAVGTSDVGMDLEETGDEAVIDIGAHVTNIVVHARGTARFVRILPSGGRDITIAIARGFEVEDDVAEQLKRGEAVEMEDAALGRRQSAEIAMQRAQNFVDEVRSLVGVLHGPGAGRPDRARARDGRRIEARRVHRAAACSGSPCRSSRVASSSTCARSSRCPRRPSPRPSPCSTVAVGLAIPGRKDREPGQPPSPGDPASGRPCAAARR